jgi:hypothetical protein
MFARVIRKLFFGTPRPKKADREHKPQLLSKNTSGSEQLWCKTPPFAPKDYVFATF